jgi:hypothetical protein
VLFEQGPVVLPGGFQYPFLSDASGTECRNEGSVLATQDDYVGSDSST